MTEALFPSDVSATTSGAILLAVAPSLAALPWLTVRDAWIAPMAAKAAATRNNEQKIRRHRDGVNVDVGFEFVIIELPMGLLWGRGDERTPKRPFYASRGELSIFFLQVLLFAGSRPERIVEAAVSTATILTSQASAPAARVIPAGGELASYFRESCAPKAGWATPNESPSLERMLTGAHPFKGVSDPSYKTSPPAKASTSGSPATNHQLSAIHYQASPILRTRRRRSRTWPC